MSSALVAGAIARVDGRRRGRGHAELRQHASSIAARRLLAAYPGPLLGGDEAAWIATPRDALRSRFVRALMELGTALQRAGDWTRAIAIYHRRLEANNLAESFHRGLMRALPPRSSALEVVSYKPERPADRRPSPAL